jgi:hypothetical protein
MADSFFDLSDPAGSLPFLSLLQGLGQASMPSHSPVPMGAVMGDAAQGLAKGYMDQQTLWGQQQDLGEKRINMLQEMQLQQLLRTGQQQPQIDYSKIPGMGWLNNIASGGTTGSPAGTQDSVTPQTTSPSATPTPVPTATGVQTVGAPPGAAAVPGAAITPRAIPGVMPMPTQTAATMPTQTAAAVAAQTAPAAAAAATGPNVWTPSANATVSMPAGSLGAQMGLQSQPTDLNAVSVANMGAETGGSRHPNIAKNPLSSATGVEQFEKGTWLRMMRKTHPELANQSDDALLAMRTDPSLSKEQGTAYAQENADTLQSHNFPVNAITLRGAHSLGPGGLEAILKAPPGTQVAGLLGPAVMKANPSYWGKTNNDMMGWFTKQTSGLPAVPPPSLAASGTDQAAAAGGVQQPGGILNNLSPEARAFIGALPWDQQSAALEKILMSPRPLTTQETADYLKAHPMESPYNTYQKDPMTGIVTVTSKSEVPSPAMIQAKTAETTAINVARNNAMWDSLGKDAQQALIDGVGSYRIPMPVAFSGRGSAFASRLYAEVMKKYPNFNAELYKSNQGLFNDMIYGKSAQTLTFIDAAKQHLDQYEQLIDEYHSKGGMVDTTFMNKLKTLYAQEFGGNPSPNALKAISQFVSGEVEKAATGGLATGGERDSMVKNLDQNLSYDTVKYTIGKLRGIMQGQENARRDHFLNNISGMSEGQARGLWNKWSGEHYAPPNQQAVTAAGGTVSDANAVDVQSGDYSSLGNRGTPLFSVPTSTDDASTGNKDAYAGSAEEKKYNAQHAGPVPMAPKPGQTAKAPPTGGGQQKPPAPAGPMKWTSADGKTTGIVPTSITSKIPPGRKIIKAAPPDKNGNITAVLLDNGTKLNAFGVMK